MLYYTLLTGRIFYVKNQGETMTKTRDVEDMDIWQDRVQQDINQLKSGQSQLKTEQDKLKGDISKMQISDQMQDKEISAVKDTLNRIQEDTTWIRRKITGAIITAVLTGLIGGVIALFFANF